MPVYVIVAYAVFLGFPLLLGASIALRWRRLRRELEALQPETHPRPGD
jgi:hypothetical protein